MKKADLEVAGCALGLLLFFFMFLLFYRSGLTQKRLVMCRDGGMLKLSGSAVPEGGLSSLVT